MSQAVPRDPYEVLGVTRDADESTIKKAFRRLARESHPDVNDEPGAEERFKEVSEAYEILSDAQTRATYDRYGHDGLRAGGFQPHADAFGSLGDILGSIFGDGVFGGMGADPTRPRQGEDLGVEVELTLAESYTGVSREVDVQVVERCEECNGNGAEPGTPIETCERCGGQGILQAVTRTPFGQAVRQVPCDVCAGDGRVPAKPCGACHGRGRVARERTLSVDIPAGIADGQRLRVPGRGHAGERGGPPGDLYVLARVPMGESMMRDGDDLVTVVDVAAPRAALGTRIEVEHPRGEDVAVDIPAGAQPAQILTVRGLGMPSVRSGRSGDLKVVVNVIVPRRLTAEQRDLLERLAESVGDDQLRTDESITGKLRRLFTR